MSNRLLEKTRGWVEKIYFNANHLIRTVYWVKRLNPDASEALVLAALTHDIERAFEEGRKPPSPEFGGAKWDDPVYNKWHSERSAKFVEEFLGRERASPQLIQEVVGLIKQHEFGGSEETNLLRDADSLSFLEVNAPIFISWVPEKLSKEEVKEKLDYMFNRIGGEGARKLAKRLYDKATSELAKT